MKFEQLVQDVGAWSKTNFEDTYHEELPCRALSGGDVIVLNNITMQAGLGSVAPLLGIGEEIGELFEASESEDYQAIEDAVGDILIYLSDWCYREGVPFPEVQTNPAAKDGSAIVFLNGVMIAYGKVIQAKLKRCQNIRGMDDKERYLDTLKKAMETLVFQLQSYMLCVYANDESEAADLWAIAKRTWDTVVSKRQRKAWPRTGIES